MGALQEINVAPALRFPRNRKEKPRRNGRSSSSLIVKRLARDYHVEDATRSVPDQQEFAPCAHPVSADTRSTQMHATPIADHYSFTFRKKPVAAHPFVPLRFAHEFPMRIAITVPRIRERRTSRACEKRSGERCRDQFGYRFHGLSFLSHHHDAWKVRPARLNQA
jgi:hypothetical protein